MLSTYSKINALSSFNTFNVYSNTSFEKGKKYYGSITHHSLRKLDVNIEIALSFFSSRRI
jgi:hypothetical protein